MEIRKKHNQSNSAKHAGYNSNSSENRKSKYLRGNLDYDPNDSIRDAQERIDAEIRKTPFYRKPFFVIFAIGAIAAGSVATAFYLDSRNNEFAIASCDMALSKGNTSDEALEQCQLAASLGDKRAIAGLSGIYVSNNRNDLALPYLRQCADDNNANCQYLLSNVYKDGINGILSSSPQMAFQYLHKSAENDSPLACYNLYKAYESGSAEYMIKENQEESIKYLKKAAEQGHPTALYLVSQNYRKGSAGFPEDFDLSISYLKKAADLGHPEALGQYGRYLLETDNYEQASAYLKKGEELRDPLSCTLIANMYQNGQVPIKGDKMTVLSHIIHLYTIGAEHDNPLAIRKLIEIYHEQEDSESYLRWIRKALGMNIPEANSYMGEALQQGYTIEAPLEPSDQIGQIIHQVIGDKPNLETAVQYYRRGVAVHDNKSYMPLLQIYLRPEFKGQLNSEIFKLAQNFAEEEPEHGLQMLAYCYSNGIGTAVNDQKTVDLLIQKITNYGDLKFTIDATRKMLTGEGPKQIPVNKNPKLASKLAVLLLDMDEQGKEEYLKICNDLINSTKSEDRGLVIHLLNNLPDQYQEKLAENSDFLLLKVKSNLAFQKNTPATLQKISNIMDQLLIREHTDAESYYADMAYDGKGLFTKPDYETALKWYEEVLPKLAKPDGTILFRMGNLYVDKISDKDYVKGLDYLQRALKEDRDLALDLIITKYVLNQPDSLKARLSNEQQYYYLKLAEMLNRQNKKTTAAMKRIQKDLTEEQISQADQMVYEEMVRRKALENSRKSNKEKN